MNQKENIMRRASVAMVFVLAAVIGFSVPVWAQAPKPTPASSAAVEKVAAKPEPALTDVQKLQVQNVLLRIELAQRTAQQAQSDFDKARTEYQSLTQSLQVPGYTLDMQQLKYTAVPKEDPKAETKSEVVPVKK